VNFSRALLLLASAGLIELDEEKTGDYLLQDITKNHKNLEFVAVESALLVRTLDDTEISTVNANYALEANYNPMKDALVIEGSSSPYVNILVSRPDNRDSEAIQKLAAALTTEKVKEFILEKYEGAVVPVF
jgi:D-methionine transport system substrate-binding protein